MKRTILALALLSSCATAGPESAVDPGAGASEPAVAAPEASVASTEASDALKLGRAYPASSLHEVVLAPDGDAALSLDERGEVRLWPRLATTDEVVPVLLPLRDSAWLSVAPMPGAEGVRAFAVASIGVSGTARVDRVEIDEGGQATLRELLVLGPEDPAFEIHVLSSGDRALLLGHDHSLRLYDLSAAVEEPSKAELARHAHPGFVPWQLRVQSEPSGGVDHVVAVLAGPTRVAPLVLSRDGIAVGKVSEGLPMDRGPNRNDLALTPDGKALVLMRRPKAKTREVHLYRVDLASGATTLLGGRIDSWHRARMLVTGSHQVLLDEGTSRGQLFDLAGAAPLEEIRTVTKRGKTRPAPAIVDGEARVLPRRLEFGRRSPDAASKYAWGDLNQRMRGAFVRRRMAVSVRNGVRVVPDQRTLVVDPLAEPHHYVHGTQRPSRVTSVAFSPDSSRLLAVGGRVTSLRAGVGDTDPAVQASEASALRWSLAMHLGADGTVTSFGRDRYVRTGRLEPNGEFVESSSVRIRMQGDPDAARFVDEPGQPLRLLFSNYRSGRAVEVFEIGQTEQRAPTEEEKPRFDALLAREMEPGTDGVRFRAREVKMHWERWSGTHARVYELAREHEGESVAVPLGRRRPDLLRFDPKGGRLLVLVDGAALVYDAASLERLWVRAVPGGSSATFSADGERVAIGHGAGVSVFSMKDGTPQLEHSTALPVHTEKLDTEGVEDNVVDAALRYPGQ